MRESAPVRVGNWNLAGRWDARHRKVLEMMDCDILLLTEVSERVALNAYDVHFGGLTMMPSRRWAAVASRLPIVPLPDPHGTSAMVELAGMRVCSSVLPWRSCGTGPPWIGVTTADKTTAAVAAIAAAAPMIWGGDWNHALSGREWAGSAAGRLPILEAVGRLGLQVPTATSPHQIDGLLSINHIAVPESWGVSSVQRHHASVAGRSLSDHDAYSVEVAWR